MDDLPFKIRIKTKTGESNDIIRIYIGRYANTRESPTPANSLRNK